MHSRDQPTSSSLRSRTAGTKHVMLLCLLFAAASSDTSQPAPLDAVARQLETVRHTKGCLVLAASGRPLRPPLTLHTLTFIVLASPCVRIPKSSQMVSRSFEVSPAKDTDVKHVVDKRRVNDRGDSLQ